MKTSLQIKQMRKYTINKKKFEMHFSTFTEYL